MGIPLNPAQQVGNLHADMGGSLEQSYATVSGSSTGTFEVFTILCPTFAASAQADYFHFVEPGGTKYAVWLDKDANNTAPTGALYVAADEQIEVEIVTGNTAAQVAAAVKAAVELNGTFAEYAISIDSATLTFTANKVGNPSNASTKTENDGAAGSFTAAVSTSGAAASSQNDYFVLRDDDTGVFHVWLNVNGEGVDPAPGGGSVGIEVTVAAAATDAQVATAIASAVDAHAEFTSSADGSRVQIVTATKAAVVDVADSDTGFTFSVSTQGRVEKYAPSIAPGSISNNPSAF